MANGDWLAFHHAGNEQFDMLDAVLTSSNEINPADIEDPRFSSAWL